MFFFCVCAAKTPIINNYVMFVVKFLEFQTRVHEMSIRHLEFMNCIEITDHL